MAIFRYFLLICIIALVCPNPQSYITLPFLRSENATHSVHNVMVQINQYPYQIDINLEGLDQYILSLSAIALFKSKTSSPDYRKHPDTVYGVLDFIGHQKADTRRTLLQQTKSNLYYTLTDLLPQQTWIGLNHIQQVGNRKSNLTQGSVNLASAKRSPFLVSLKKHNPYIRESIISFKLSKNNKNGQIYFGTFPKHELFSPSEYSEINLENDHQKAWKINIAAIKLKHSTGQDQKAAATNLFAMPVRASLSLSQKTLQLPKQVGLSLQTMLNGCSMKQYQSQTLFACRVSSLDLYKDFAIQLSLPNAKTPIELKLSDLVREIVDGQAILNIREGSQDNYHISSNILREYLIGIDYSSGLFSYGRKRSDQWLDRYLLAKIFIAVNVITFIFSALILSVTHKLKPSTEPSQSAQSLPEKQKQVYSASKASGYQMAAMSEESPQQLQD